MVRVEGQCFLSNPDLQLGKKSLLSREAWHAHSTQSTEKESAKAEHLLVLAQALLHRVSALGIYVSSPLGSELAIHSFV